MALIDKLTAIASAIREKSGKSDTLTLDEMPAEIRALTAEDIIQHTNIPDYVKKEASEIVNKVRSVQTAESIIFLAMSDSHYYGTQGESGVDAYVDSNGVQGNISNLHGAMAAKILAYSLGFDFMAHLGDASWGHGTTHLELLNSQIDTLFSMLHEAHKDLPCFHAIGNHDTGYYYGTFESGENLYNKFTALSASEKTVFGGAQYGGYCYRDFEEKKLRVFLLNTSEYHIYNETDSGTLGSQRLWLANALLDLNNKQNAPEWGYIILSHYPADYGATMPLSELLKAYVEGGNISISLENGTTSSVSFSGKNGAKFIAQFHGHVHNFITSKLHSTATGAPVQYNAQRVCIPNGQFNRENYYDVVSGINFKEDTTYNKTADTANDTSFVVNVINPSEEKIYSFCYGAGYDRVIGFAATVYYSVSASLTHVTSSSDVLSVEAGTPYSATLTVTNGYELKTIKVTMGGVDVTASVYNNGVITIPEVTGNITITARAEARPKFTNLVPLSINSDGSKFNVDGDGYDNGKYISSSGSLGDCSGNTATGFIPVSAGAKTIRIAGENITTDSEYTRVAFYNSDFSLAGDVIPLKRMGSSVYFGTITDEATTALTWSIDATNMAGQCAAPYIRICTKGDGANLIVTVNEEISYGGPIEDENVTYSIIQNLTNVTSSNQQSIVTEGSSFSTTLTINSGHELESVIVKMGGIDITDQVYTESTGKISIESVIGSVIITAIAGTNSSTSYTNQIPLSIDTDGNLYNPPYGYQTGLRVSTSTMTESAATGMCLTGFIPCTDGDIIRIKNITVAGSQTPCAMTYKFLSNGQYNDAGVYNGTGITFLSSDMIADSDGVITLTIPAGKGINYIRLSCGVIDETSILTINEPIE